MDLSEEKKIKTLSSKMTTNTIINNYILKTYKNRNRIIDRKIIWRVIRWEGKEENGGKGTGNKKHNW